VIHVRYGRKNPGLISSGAKLFRAGKIKRQGFLDENMASRRQRPGRHCDVERRGSSYDHGSQLCTPKTLLPISHHWNAVLPGDLLAYRRPIVAGDYDGTLRAKKSPHVAFADRTAADNENMMTHRAHFSGSTVSK
jgi:hypothetical protein